MISSLFFPPVMDYQVTEMGSLFPSGIKRHVKDKRMSKTTKLNVSLASKIKTKIISKCHWFYIYVHFYFSLEN